MYLQPEPAAEVSPPPSNIWTGVAIGVGAMTLLGLVGFVAYLMTRKNQDHLSGPPPALPPPMLPPLPAPAPTVFVIHSDSSRRRGDEAGLVEVMSTPTMAAVPIAANIEATVTNIESKFTRPAGQPYMGTMRVPSLTNPKSQAIRLLQAGDMPFEAILRVVGPAGSYAAFSVDANDLNLGSPLPSVSPPTGSTLIVQSGQHHPLRLGPRQAVFAKGSVDGVIVSVNAGEAGGRVYG